MKRLICASLMALALTVPARAATTILDGIVCDNTCLGYRPGDNTPDYLALFGPPFGNLTSLPFHLETSATGYSLTINSHTLSFGFNDPHYSISFTDPLLASFTPGAAVFRATGFNPYGFAVAETEFLCPAVPEPGTWALMLLGFLGLGSWFRWKEQPSLTGKVWR